MFRARRTGTLTASLAVLALSCGGGTLGGQSPEASQPDTTSFDLSGPTLVDITSTDAGTEVCSADAGTLCLHDGRFELTLRWRTRASASVTTAEARAIDGRLSGAFVDAADEVPAAIVKILDGTPVNGYRWVFFNSITERELWLDVRDVARGELRTYHSVDGRGGADVRAFPGEPLAFASPTGEATALVADALPCSTTAHCFLDGRFRAEVRWATNNGLEGIARPVVASDVAGLFSFFRPRNIEMVVHVIDGRAINGRFWVLHAALSNLEYDLEVTDTLNGEVATYHNPQGSFGGHRDADAFPRTVDEPAAPRIPADELFVLSPDERAVFAPPPGWEDFGHNYEDPPLERLWQAFNEGRAVQPLGLDGHPAGWFQPDGAGSQNHALLWMGTAALGFALTGDVPSYERAADYCLRLLELDQMQGHMRHEAMGYMGFWEGGIAAMTLAGLHAPTGSANGDALLAEARRWWREHVAVLRTIVLPDGQLPLVGARMKGGSGETDSWGSLSAAVNLQLIDPRPYAQLHPTIAAIIGPDGRPVPRTMQLLVRWDRPRHVAERWVVLRAVQSGAIEPVDAQQPTPAIVQRVFRWSDGDRVHTATPRVIGFRAARWHVSWRPGTVVRIEVGDPAGVQGGKGLPYGHLPPSPVVIPARAVQVLGASE